VSFLFKTHVVALSII